MLLVSIGGLISLIGIIWLVVLAIQTGKTGGEKALWAVVNIFGCQPLGGIVFYFVKKVGLIPLIMVIVGNIIAGIGIPSYLAEVQNMINTMPR